MFDDWLLLFLLVLVLVVCVKKTRVGFIRLLCSYLGSHAKIMLSCP